VWEIKGVAYSIGAQQGDRVVPSRHYCEQLGKRHGIEELLDLADDAAKDQAATCLFDGTRGDQ
jgi:hypothetical protein